VTTPPAGRDLLAGKVVVVTAAAGTGIGRQPAAAPEHAARDPASLTGTGAAKQRPAP
jgi:hypothetical protein